MTHRVSIALAALVLSLAAVAYGQGRVAPAVIQNTLVHNDTLPRFAADSVVTTAAVSIDGARGFMVYVVSSGTDTITAIIQTRIPGGDWTGAGTTKFYPGVVTTTAGGVNTTTTGNMLFTSYCIYDAVAGGTPLPCPGEIRLRLKSADQRLYQGASLTNLALTGTIKVTVRVIS